MLFRSYRALCFLALNMREQAEAQIELVLGVDPLFVAGTYVSPRVRAFVDEVRTRLLPTLAQLTTAEQRWADREEDITTVGGDPFEVGQVFARRWMERLPEQSHVQRLAGMYPRIPHRIDGELLRYAARFGLLAHKDDQIDEHDRYAIRAGFWREIDVRAAAEHAPAPEQARGPA